MSFVVFRNISYYPYVVGEYSSREEAEEIFNEYKKDYPEEELFLCLVLDKNEEDSIKQEVKE